MSGTRIGVALFMGGSPYSREGNFACEYQGEPFEFFSVSDLPSQTLWVTNVNLGDLIDLGLHKNPKIAHDGYFRTRIAQISQELGLDTLSLEQQSSFLAEMLGITAEMGRIELGLTQYPAKSFVQAVGQLHGYREHPAGSPVYTISEQSCQRYTSAERSRRIEDAEIFSFWMPRYEWANDLLETGLPTGENAQVIPAHNLPEMGRDAVALVQWAEENKIPLFANIRINQMEESVGRLINYGAGAQGIDSGGYDARNLREWCALPELAVLAYSGDIEILKVVTAGGWARSGLHLNTDKVARVSYSYGLLSENIWSGLTRKPDAFGKVSKTMQTAWMQSLERMKCLRVAERLQGLGMDILNYGNGRITVACPPSIRAFIPQAALEESMLYPCSLKDLKFYDPSLSADPFVVMQSLIANKQYARILEVDNVMLNKLKSKSA